MAIAVTAVVNNPNYKSWTVTALDADTATSFTHGMTNALGTAVTPDELEFTPSVTFASTATPSFGATANATSIFFVKSNTTGSGGLTAGTTVIGKLYAKAPHSIGQ